MNVAAQRRAAGLEPVGRGLLGGGGHGRPPVVPGGADEGQGGVDAFDLAEPLLPWPVYGGSLAVSGVPAEPVSDIEDIAVQLPIRGDGELLVILGVRATRARWCRPQCS